MHDHELTYLFVTQLSIALILSAVFLVSWFTIERKPHTLLWSIAFGLAVVNGLMNASRDLFPSSQVYWVLVSASSLLILMSGFAGFRLRAGLKAMPWWLITFFCAMELLVFWFTFVDPHIGLSMTFVPMTTTIIVLSQVAILLIYDKERTATIIAACVVFAVYGISQFSSAVVVAMMGPEAVDAYLDRYRQINLLIQPACFAGMGIFTALIVADDLAKRMRTLALTDGLSGLANRRGFEDGAARAMSSARRRDQPLSLVICDIDYFKKVNDSFGHAAGDAVIKAFSQVLESSVRGEDFVARIGGEEFAILLQGTTANEAARSIERIRNVVESTTVTHDKRPVRFTASFGIAPVALDSEDIGQALKDADDALYRAKTSGRNRVEVY